MRLAMIGIAIAVAIVGCDARTEAAGPPPGLDVEPIVRALGDAGIPASVETPDGDIVLVKRPTTAFRSGREGKLELAITLEVRRKDGIRYLRMHAAMGVAAYVDETHPWIDDLVREAVANHVNGEAWASFTKACDTGWRVVSEAIAEGEVVFNSVKSLRKLGLRPITVAESAIGPIPPRPDQEALAARRERAWARSKKEAAEADGETGDAPTPVAVGQ